jgi:hypothetical protein
MKKLRPFCLVFFSLCIFSALAAPAQVLVATNDASPVLVQPTAASEPVAGTDMSSSLDSVALPDAPEAQTTSSSQTATQMPAPQNSNELKQTQRIFYIIPNFKSAMLSDKLPPLSNKEKFTEFASDTFDYSAWAYVAIWSGANMGTDSHPEFGGGNFGVVYGRYYWHSFLDNAGGNVFTEWLGPVALHADPRYYALGHRNVLIRTGYSLSRLIINKTDKGNEAPNFSEMIGDGAGAGLSSLYYPSKDRSFVSTYQLWISNFLQDGFSNLIKEFWPDLNRAISNRHSNN